MLHETSITGLPPADSSLEPVGVSRPPVLPVQPLVSVSSAEVPTRGQLASHDHRELLNRKEVAAQDLRLRGNVLLVSDIHLGKGDGTEAAANLESVLDFIRAHRDTITKVIFMGDLSDASVPYERRRAIIIDTVARAAEALDSATTGKRVEFVFGNHDVERRQSLEISVAGEERTLKLANGRLVSRPTLSVIKAFAESASNSETNPEASILITPSQIQSFRGPAVTTEAAQAAAQELRALNVNVGRDENFHFSREVLESVIIDFQKRQELKDSLEAIPGVDVVSENHRMGSYVKIGDEDAIVAHDPIMNGENLVRILGAAHEDKPTLRIGRTDVAYVFLADQHTIGLVEHPDFDTVTVGALAANDFRRLGNPASIALVNPEASGRVHFYEVTPAGAQFIELENIGFVEPTYHQDPGRIHKMVVPRG